MEFEDVKNYIYSIGTGLFFLLMGLLLIFDEEIMDPNNINIFFFMTGILAILIFIVGVLLIIVGIYGIQDEYRSDQN
ncbi:MAG: hypothetical protein ACXAC7_02730 [Candidatus Hodarchaeales archaeon]|jgi:uncharacterized membrane protein